MKAIQRQILYLLLLICSFDAAAVSLTIGSGKSTTSSYPLNTCYGYNYSQTIYLASELVSAGAVAGTPAYIYSIEYNQTTASLVPSNWKDWVIYMGNTSAVSFNSTTPWLPVSTMTEVFNSTVTPTGTGWYTITFSIPFYWDGVSNIVIAIDENTSGSSCISSWQSTNIGKAPDYRSIMYRNSAIDPDPSTPPTATTRGLLYPDIKINYVPAVSCSGTPAGGTANAEPATVCPGKSTNITVSGATIATDLSYSWESAVTATGPWTRISGATKGSLTVSSPTCTSIFYRRQTTCTGSGISSPSSSILITGTCAVPTPYLETFENIKAYNELPACMSASRLSDYVYTYLSATGSSNQINHTPGGNNFASFRYGANDYIFTPQISLGAGKTYEFSFWYISDGYPGWDTLEAKIGTAATAAAMTTTIGSPINSPKNTTYKLFKGQFTVTGAGNYFIGIHCKANSSSTYLSVDDLQLQEVLPCNGKPATGSPLAEPERICGSGVTELTLPYLVSALGYTYQWQDSMAGGTWGTGPRRPSWGGSTLPFNTGLISSNIYFRCIVTCGATGDTSISPPLFIAAGVLNLPYKEDFEHISYEDQFPDCMNLTNTDIIHTATSAMSYNAENHTPGGSKYAYFRFGAADSLTTPGLNLKTGYQYTFSFWYSTDGIGGWDYLDGFINAGPGKSAILLKALRNPTNTSYLQYKDTFTVSASGTYYAGIRCYATYEPWYLCVDDINIQALPCSGTPDTGVISGTAPSGTFHCTGTAITLKSSGATLSIEGISYQWQRKKSGGGTWTDIAGATDTIYSSDTAIGWDHRFTVTCKNSGITAYSAAYELPAYPAHPPVNILRSDTVHFCIGDTVMLQATAFAGVVYTWNIGGKELPGWKFNDLVARDSGVYTVDVSSAVSPCPARSRPIYLIGNDPGFTVGLITPRDSFLCEKEKLLLKSIAAPGLSLQWQRNSIDIPGATAADYEVNVTGAYRVKASDGSGCPAVSRAIPISVRSVPAAFITTPDAARVACSEEGLRLDASRGDDLLYQWSRNGKLIYGRTDSSMIAKDDGIYTVQIRYPSGCVAVSPDISVTILPSPAVDILRSGLVLRAVAGPFKTYQWYRNDNLMAGHNSDTLQLWYNGRYTVKVAAPNGCTGTSPAFDVLEDGLMIPAMQQQNIHLYPNPTAQTVFLDVPVPFKVSVKNISGHTILEAEDAAVIDLSQYADGIYLFTISDKQDKLLKLERISKQAR